MKLTRKDVFNLCVAIVNTAAKDYNDLKERGVSMYRNSKKGESYSVEEIDEFFKSGWAEQIVQDGMGLRRMTGVDIFNRIKNGASFEGVI